MIKIPKHIEIVGSSKSAFSSMSRRSRDAARATLGQHYTRVGITLVDTVADLDALVASAPDLVFLAMKFLPSDAALGLQDPNKIWIAQYLEAHGIAYTGSNEAAHIVEQSKPLAKQRVRRMGLKTSPFFVVPHTQPRLGDSIPLSFPVFIKPTDRGGGEGIDGDSIAYNLDQLQAKVYSIAHDLQADSLIEEYLPGREFSVAILKNEHSPDYWALPIEKIAAPDKNGQRLLSGAVKSADAVQDAVVTDSFLKARLSTFALNAFHALGARDYGRIDIRLDGHGIPNFLEANLLPSLIQGYGSFPKSCLLNMDLDYEAMLLRIVRLALARNLSTDQDSPATLPVLETIFQPVTV